MPQEIHPCADCGKPCDCCRDRVECEGCDDCYAYEEDYEDDYEYEDEFCDDDYDDDYEDEWDDEFEDEFEDS